MSSTFRKIIDEELEFAEKSVLNGGYLPATISARIAGVSRKYIYKLGEKGRVEMLIVDGQKFFSVPDCVRVRREKRQLGDLRKNQIAAKVPSASAPRQ